MIVATRLGQKYVTKAFSCELHHQVDTPHCFNPHDWLVATVMVQPVNKETCISGNFSVHPLKKEFR